jgi:hypothetical protein
MVRKLFLLLLVAAAFTAGCSMTTVHDEWKEPGTRGHSFKSFLVIGLPDNSPIGNECADEFVKHLKERGVKATAGYAVLPPRSQREAVMAKAREIGSYAVLVSTFRERRSQLDIYPSQDQSLLLWPDLYMWSPDQVVENNYDVFATFLYDSTTGQPVWSALSDTLAGQSERKVLKSYVKAILRKMEKEGLLPK